MVSPEHKPLLPRVDESDLLSLVFDDATDPSHVRRWLAFAGSNKLLAHEILERAFIASDGDPTMQKRIIDEITYVYAALATAALRLTQEGPTSTDVGVGDEG